MRLSTSLTVCTDLFLSAKGNNLLDSPWKLRRLQWLCHSDARQVSDLPIGGLLRLQRSLTGQGRRPDEKKGSLSASRRLAAHQCGRAIRGVTQSRFLLC